MNNELETAENILQSAYNTRQEVLAFPEYGRNIKLLVDHLATVEDRDKRTENAKEIVNLMCMISGTQKGTVEQNNKIWEHLYILSKGTLDVDVNFVKPLLEEKVMPQRVAYPSNKITYKHYGLSLEKLVKTYLAMDNISDEDKKVLFTRMVMFMKSSYRYWQKEVVSTEIVCRDLCTLSNGKIDISSADIDENFTREYKPKTTSYKKTEGGVAYGDSSESKEYKPRTTMPRTRTIE